MSKVESLLLFLLICLIPSQLSTHHWLAGLNFPRSDYLSFSVYLTDVIALSILSIRLFSGRLRLLEWITQKRYQVVVIAVFVLTNVAFSLLPLLSAFKWLQLLLYVILFSEYNWSSKVSRRLLISAFSISLLWISSLAIAQSLLSHSVGGLLYWLGERPLVLNTGSIAKIDLWFFGPTLRTYATFPHPNALAGFILISLAGVLTFNRALPILKPKHLYLLMAFSFFALLSTFSFSAFFIGSMYLLLSQITGKYSAARKAGIAFLLLLLTAILVFTIRPVSILDRLDQLPSSLHTIANHPLTGTGLGVYVLGSAKSISRFGSFYQPVHNIILLLIAEIGLGGVVVLSLLIKKFISFEIKSYFSPSLALVYAITALGLFDHYWFTSHSNLILVVLLFVINFQKNVRFKST